METNGKGPPAVFHGVNVSDDLVFFTVTVGACRSMIGFVRRCRRVCSVATIRLRYLRLHLQAPKSEGTLSGISILEFRIAFSITQTAILWPRTAMRILYCGYQRSCCCSGDSRTEFSVSLMACKVPSGK